MKIDKVNPKPCPFCGMQPAIQKKTLSEVHAYADQILYCCSGCGLARGAMGDTSKGGYADNSTVAARALENWNMRKPMDELISERDQLKAENESLRKDAERLDWIEDNYTGHGGGTEFNLRLHLPCDLEGGGLRHAIDTAIAKEHRQ